MSKSSSQNTFALANPWGFFAGFDHDNFAVRKLDEREERVHFSLPKPLRVKT